jgi:hypothetical protein
VKKNSSVKLIVFGILSVAMYGALFSFMGQLNTHLFRSGTVLGAVTIVLIAIIVAAIYGKFAPCKTNS